MPQRPGARKCRFRTLRATAACPLISRGKARNVMREIVPRVSKAGRQTAAQAASWSDAMAEFEKALPGRRVARHGGRLFETAAQAWAAQRSIRRSPHTASRYD